MGSFKVKLVVWFALLALIPLAVAFYGYDTLARRSETRRADASLEAGIRAGAPAYAGRLAAATATARDLAARPDVQAALRNRDRKTLARLLPRRPAPPVAVRTVSVVGSGRVLGAVSAYVPIREGLLGTLASGLGPAGRLVAVQSKRVVAGPGKGAVVDLEPGEPARVVVDGRTYRGLLTGS